MKIDDHAFVLNLRMATEVYQQSHTLLNGMQVIQDLGKVVVTQIGNGFYLEQYLVKQDEVGLEDLVKEPAKVLDTILNLRLKWDRSFREFDRETLLVDRFEKPATHLIADLKTRTDDCVGLVRLKHG